MQLFSFLLSSITWHKTMKTRATVVGALLTWHHCSKAKFSPFHQHHMEMSHSRGAEQCHSSLIYSTELLKINSGFQTTHWEHILQDRKCPGASTTPCHHTSWGGMALVLQGPMVLLPTLDNLLYMNRMWN